MNDATARGLCVWCEQSFPQDQMQTIPGTDVRLCAGCMARYNGTTPISEKETA